MGTILSIGAVFGIMLFAYGIVNEDNFIITVAIGWICLIAGYALGGM